MIQRTSPAAQRARFARPTDVSEIVRLRSCLLSSGEKYYASRSASEDLRWREEFEAWALSHACDTRSIAMAVIDAPNRVALCSCAIGIIDTRPPGPGAVNGKTGWMQSLVTDPHFRRQGLASEVMAFLLAWFERSDVHRIFLNATPDGASLYQGFGFTPCGEDALVWQAPRDGEC